MKSRQSGFTLVEIAIVLVIIGLLLGGILKGQEMIAQAKIKNVINDMNGVTAAFNSYQDRYRALPGDDKNAVTRWTTLAANQKGDGNGVVGGVYVPAAVTDESALYWLHLRQAGFISGTGVDNPFNAVSGKMGVQTGDGAAGAAGVLATTVGTTTGPGFTGLILCTANLPDKVAISVDAQTDDGNGQAGSVRGMDQVGTANPTLVSGAAASAYVEDGTKSYLVCRTML
jgi:prepilin-type N-terminal cleavage/methylation domain-containing protein